MGVSETIPGLTWNHDLQNLSLLGSWITGVSHQSADLVPGSDQFSWWDSALSFILEHYITLCVIRQSNSWDSVSFPCVCYMGSLTSWCSTCVMMMDTEDTIGLSKNSDKKRSIVLWPRWRLSNVHFLELCVPKVQRTLKGKLNVFQRSNTSELSLSFWITDSIVMECVWVTE
jgi:hypothetical protein